MFEELSEQYGQFIVMALVFLVGAAVYGGYVYYQKQEDMKRINSDMTNVDASQQNQEKPSQSKPSQNQEQPEFVPSDNFKGEQPGYTFKKGDKGQGYYKDN